jgi:hypothetical protein
MVAAGKNRSQCTQVTPLPFLGQPFDTNTPIQYVRLRLDLLLGRADMRVVHLGGELETCYGLLQVGLQWADHDKHERLGVAAE